jgi:hypothetical protein
VDGCTELVAEEGSSATPSLGQMSAPATALDPVIRRVPVRVLRPALIQAPAPAQVPASSHAAVPVLSPSQSQLASQHSSQCSPVQSGDNATPRLAVLVTAPVTEAAELVGDYFQESPACFAIMSS